MCSPATYALGMRLAAPVLIALLIATLVLGVSVAHHAAAQHSLDGISIRVLMALCTAGFVLAASAD
jgi:hypothetical protein